jgi:hypothetical protein
MLTSRSIHAWLHGTRDALLHRILAALVLIVSCGDALAADQPEANGTIGRALVNAGFNPDQSVMPTTASDETEPLEFFLRDQFEMDGDAGEPSLPPPYAPSATESRRGIDPSRVWTSNDATQQFPTVPPPPDEPLPLPVFEAGPQSSGNSTPQVAGRKIVRPRAVPVRDDDEEDDEPARLRGALSSAVCACEARWVNWRCGSDRLEGCVPEGYNALPIMNSAPAAALYGTPLYSGGSVEPGGSYDQAVQVSGHQTKPITRLTTSIALPPGRLPANSAAARFAQVPPRAHVTGTHRDWNGVDYYWSASHLAHQPLYFEDVNLERNGYSFGVLQPVVSAARFYATFPVLPYFCGAHPPYGATYTLGEPRPGSPAPYVIDRPKASIAGGLLEAATVSGLFFAIP